MVETVGVGIGASPPQTSLVSWEPSNGAEIYHVYWRRRPLNDKADENKGWSQKSQALTGRKIHNANEIVVIAVNSYGASQATKLIFDAEKASWTPTF